MNNLLLVKEIFTDGYIAYILDIISLFTVFCSVMVIISKNPVVSVLFLIGLFAGISCYLILIGLGFMGLAYLVVYIGAISILFLFILMLINIRISELQSNTLNTIPLAFIIGSALNISLIKIFPYYITAKFELELYLNSSIYPPLFWNWNWNKYTTPDNVKLSQFFANHLYFVASNKWDGNLAETGHITSIGSVMYTNYNMWLLIASFILLLAMVGCIVITLKPSTPRNNS